jgi:3-deoxy-D-manno-octulosonic-acid transferase
MVLYNAGIFLYFLVIRIAALFNRKAKLLASAQKNWKKDLTEKLKSVEAHPKIWIHCASVGEFEQGRPVIEGLRKNYPEFKIVLSFFSPSGYELHQNYELADVVIYLPRDTKQNAVDFIACCKPKTVIFVKYEFWLHYLFELKKQNIATYLISAVIREHQPFFKWYGRPFREGLRAYKTIFVQDEESLNLLKSIHVNNGMLCGDTRIDRVVAIRVNARELTSIKDFCDGAKVIIAGSTWANDEGLLVPAIVKLKTKFKDLKLILTPHEVDPSNITRIEKELGAMGLNYALYTKGEFSLAEVLVVDTVGILSSLYRYGYLAYIGGGFNDGIHNILEPAVQGLPVLFGPKHQKFNEARDLLKLNGAMEIRDENSLLVSLENYLSMPQLTEKASAACHAYVNANKGASEKILKQIEFNYSTGL